MSRKTGAGTGGVQLSLTYRAPGPVCAAYIRSHARVKVIMGPVGSGKTRGMLFDGLNRACCQPPSPVDGVRRYRTCTVRATYRQLWKSTIESWNKLVPKDIGTWVGGNDQPVRHTIEIDHPSGDGTVVEYVRDFLALGDNSLEEACRGYEPTDWELDELDTLPDDVISYCLSRAGRYPDKVHGFPWWYGVRAATNAFEIDSAFYNKLVENRPPEWKLYIQPGGLHPKAENRANLVPTYYQDQMVGADPSFIRKFVHNEFGYSRDGKPVYGEFHDHLHVSAEPLKPVAGLPLVIGADAGLTPAAVICQRAPDGRWLVLDELVFDGGGQAFGEQLNRLLAEPRYRDVLADATFLRLVGDRASAEQQRRRSLAQAVQGWCDPAAGARVATDERSWVEVVSAVTGISFRPAPSNALSLRLEAVRQPLARLIDGRPGVLISPTCKVLRRGFNSSYRFKRVFVGGAQVRYVDQPDKNEASHVHDALQYAMLGGGGYHDVRVRATPMQATGTEAAYAQT